MKIKEYRVCHIGDGDDPSACVEAEIKEGWQPIGGIANAGDGYWAQAMVKYETAGECIFGWPSGRSDPRTWGQNNED